MFDLPRACFLFLIILLMLPGVPQANAAGSAITDQKVELVEEEVLEILSRSNDYLASLKQFQVKAEFGFDVLQETGQKIEFGSHQEITMQRPDRLRIDFSRRGGDHGSVVYDGQEVVLFNPEEGVYAKAPFKGEVDTALDFLAKELERPVPLKDFLASNPHDALLEKIESGLYVGEAMINGTLCDHLAMRNDRVDFQLWIAQGDVPLPRRIVITHKNEEGQPQFWGQFLNWETSPEISTGTFSYSPPEGAERIPFAVVDVEMRDKGGQK